MEDRKALAVVVFLLGFIIGYLIVMNDSVLRMKHQLEEFRGDR